MHLLCGCAGDSLRLVFCGGGDVSNLSLLKFYAESFTWFLYVEFL